VKRSNGWAGCRLVGLLGIVAAAYAAMAARLGWGGGEDAGHSAGLLSVPTLAMAAGGLLVRSRSAPAAPLFAVVGGAGALSALALYGGGHVDPFALAGAFAIQGAAGHRTRCRTRPPRAVVIACRRIGGRAAEG
jgi:hypothetical protein